MCLKTFVPCQLMIWIMASEYVAWKIMQAATKSRSSSHQLDQIHPVCREPGSCFSIHSVILTFPGCEVCPGDLPASTRHLLWCIISVISLQKCHMLLYFLGVNNLQTDVWMNWDHCVSLSDNPMTMWLSSRSNRADPFHYWFSHLFYNYSIYYYNYYYNCDIISVNTTYNVFCTHFELQYHTQVCFDVICGLAKKKYKEACNTFNVWLHLSGVASESH